MCFLMRPPLLMPRNTSNITIRRYLSSISQPLLSHPFLLLRKIVSRVQRKRRYTQPVDFAVCSVGVDLHGDPRLFELGKRQDGDPGGRFWERRECIKGFCICQRFTGLCSRCHACETRVETTVRRKEGGENRGGLLTRGQYRRVPRR